MCHPAPPGYLLPNACRIACTWSLALVDWIYIIILVSAGLIVISIFTSLIAFRFGAPLLLVFLMVGLGAGEDGLGLQFSDADAAYFIGSLALAIILFDSGFSTTLASLRQAAAPAVVLATLGVLITTAIVALAAHFLLGIAWLQSFMLGAVVGSTDAAAVFFLLRAGRITIKESVRATLEVESGSNDPMAIFLTVTFLALIASAGLATNPIAEFLLGFGLQMGLGLVMGLLGGAVIVFIVNRVELEGALYPVMVGLAERAQAKPYRLTIFDNVCVNHNGFGNDRVGAGLLRRFRHRLVLPVDDESPC